MKTKTLLIVGTLVFVTPVILYFVNYWINGLWHFSTNSTDWAAFGGMWFGFAIVALTAYNVWVSRNNNLKLLRFNQINILERELKELNHLFQLILKKYTKVSSLDRSDILDTLITYKRNKAIYFKDCLKNDELEQLVNLIIAVEPFADWSYHYLNYKNDNIDDELAQQKALEISELTDKELKKEREKWFDIKRLMNTISSKIQLDIDSKFNLR